MNSAKSRYVSEQGAQARPEVTIALEGFCTMTRLGHIVMWLVVCILGIFGLGLMSSGLVLAQEVEPLVVTAEEPTSTRVVAGGSESATYSDSPMASVSEKVPADEMLMAKYPEWYGLVKDAVKTADDAHSDIDFGPVVNSFIVPFNRDASKTSFEIYDFIKLLEEDEAGSRLIQAMKKGKGCKIEISANNRFGYVGNFVGTIFYGQIIFGNPEINNYCVNGPAPTIIFGPNIDSTLRGGDGFTFLYGGDGNDILRGDGDGIPERFASKLLAGGNGDDIYLYPNHGTSHIYENNTAEAGLNSLHFAEGIRPNDLHLAQISDSLVIAIPRIHYSGMVFISNWFHRSEYDNRDPAIVKKYPPICKFIFADGTVLGPYDIAEILKQDGRPGPVYRKNNLWGR